MTIFGSFNDEPATEPFPGVFRRTFSTDKVTVTSYAFEPGASFPTHHHPQEQSTLVEEGEVTFTVRGVSQEMVAGEWSVVEPHAEHGLTAGPSGARILALIVPPRETTDEYTISP